MKFIKMQGLGNDYVYVDTFAQQVRDPAALAVRVSRPHYGVGADGLILIGPSDKADARMRIFNADGSEAEMCGNGLRCTARYLYETGRAPAGTIPGEGCGNHAFVPLSDGTVREFTCVSMGNPHAVLFVQEAPRAWCLENGPLVERDAHFPMRTNVEVVRVLARDHLEVFVWERGSGATLACGTGACARRVAAVLDGLAERRARVELPGGALRADGHVGVYSGGGYAVEERGFNYGCVKTRVSSRNWTHWYKLPFIDYGEGAEHVPATENTLGSRLLKKGMEGSDVKALQELLLQLGYDLPRYGADGEFGAETLEAVKAFQKDEGLEVDGKYGEKTHAALMDAVADADADGSEQEGGAAGAPVEPEV